LNAQNGGFFESSENGLKKRGSSTPKGAENTSAKDSPIKRGGNSQKKAGSLAAKGGVDKPVSRCAGFCGEKGKQPKVVGVQLGLFSQMEKVGKRSPLGWGNRCLLLQKRGWMILGKGKKEGGKKGRFFLRRGFGEFLFLRGSLFFGEYSWAPSKDDVGPINKKRSGRAKPLMGRKKKKGRKFSKVKGKGKKKKERGHTEV